MRASLLAAVSALVAVTLAAAGELRPAASAPAAWQGDSALKQAEQAGIDIGNVIETVSHRVEPAKDDPGRLVSEDRLYRAEFGASGFSLTLRRNLSERELVSREKAWRASLPPDRESTRGEPRDRTLPAEAIPFERKAAFSIRTTRVLRGRQPLAISRAEWLSERNSAWRMLAPALSERVTARDGALEWEFILDRAPTGAGALTVEARVSAAEAAERRAGSKPAWAFRAEAGRSVTVGTLVVKDARGRDLYRGLPGFVGRTLSLTVPSRVLRRAAYPVTIDPIVSPEYAVSEPVYGRRRGAYSPAVAFDGANYLVVWTDSSPYDRYWIYGTRVSPAGTVLDQGGILISRVAHAYTVSALGFDGTNYLLVWLGSQSGDTDGFRESDVYGARVSPAGVVLDPDGISISREAVLPLALGLAFDGANYLVVWDDSRLGDREWDIFGARVSRAGAVLDPDGIRFSTAGGVAPSVAFDGTNYLVSWEWDAGGGVQGSRVSPAGIVLDPDGIVIATGTNSQARPAIAFDGTNYLVVWSDRHLSSTDDVYGARVTPAGTVLDPDGIAISTAASDQVFPAVAFDGTNYMVVWADSGTNYDVYGARVTPAGAVLDPEGIAIPISAYGAALAFDGTNYLVVGTGIEGARVSTAGTVLDPGGILISTGVNDQFTPALAFDGTNYLVVWRDRRSVDSDIYGARVSRRGVILDGGGIAISTAAGDQYMPAIAFDRRTYLVVWEDHRSGRDNYDIYGARVTRAGAVLDADGIPISTAANDQYQPGIAFDGTNYLVAWTDIRSYPQYAVYGTRVSTAGTVLDPAGIAISISANSQLGEPSLAFDGTNYLVAWQDSLSNDIHGARVTTAGAVLDPDGITISTPADSQVGPTALAFDGTNYLVVWTRWYPHSDIYGARVNPAGLVLDPEGIAIATAADSQSGPPALAFDGTNYVIAWVGTGPDIYGARVTPGGDVLEPFAIATAGTSESYPAVARGPAGRGPRNRSGRVAVAYERPVLEAPYDGAERVFLRFLRPTPRATKSTTRR